jgi:hypothetical protein
MMKHKPFEKLLQPFLAKEEQVTTTTAVKKKKATKATVKAAVKAARQMRKDSPHLTLKEMAALTGIHEVTLGKHLRAKKIYKRGPYKKTSRQEVSEAKGETMRIHLSLTVLAENVLAAQQNYEAAKQRLKDFLSKEDT